MLIVDEDATAGERLAQHLRVQGYRVVATTRGAEALRLAEVAPLAVAVVDVSVADMAGSELARQLRSIRAGLPVIMTSADAQEQREVEARAAGILHYALKPLDLDRLHAIVDWAVAPIELRDH